MKKCVFCDEKLEKIYETELSFVIYDKFPVSKGHILIIPKRHVESYFDLSINEKEDLFTVLDKMKNILDEKYNPNGYNFGVNVGKVAGQSVMHVHLHLIPRYSGDLENPKGGIRGCIPEKMSY